MREIKKKRGSCEEGNKIKLMTIPIFGATSDNNLHSIEILENLNFNIVIFEIHSFVSSPPTALSASEN